MVSVEFHVQFKSYNFKVLLYFGLFVLVRVVRLVANLRLPACICFGAWAGLQWAFGPQNHPHWKNQAIHVSIPVKVLQLQLNSAIVL